MFSLFQGCSLFVCCWFWFIFHIYLTITVSILNILPFLFGHFYIFIDDFKSYVFHHFVGQPSVVARFLGRCSREEPGRPVTGSMSSSSVDYNDTKMILKLYYTTIL